MKKRRSLTETYDLFDAEHSVPPARHGFTWPSAVRFPLNLGGRRVRDTVVADLRSATSPLIVTGFASLDELIGLVSSVAPNCDDVRILLGSEPYPGRRDEYRLDDASFSDEIETHWIQRGVSLLLSAKLIAFIERLKTGVVEVRYLRQSGSRLHAKIHVGDDGVTVGSSNFTRSGLDRQLEANARFSSRQEPRRFRELRNVAENFWKLGRDYRDELIAFF